MANEKILVVEDDSAVADVIARFLTRSGYTVAACVATGDGALHRAAELHPDLVLMDISLRGDLDGVQTAARLRTRFDIPVVFLTGRADDETLLRSQEAKAFGYLLKPFRQEELKASIDLALSKHRFESRLRRIEVWFSAAVKATGEAVITTDEGGRVTFLNPVAEALTGWKLSDALDGPLEKVFQVGDEKRTTAWPAPDELLNPAPGPLPVPRLTTLRTREGRSIPIEGSMASMRNEAGAAIGRVLVFRDITERRRTEEDLSQSREQLRSLAAHLQRVREEERTRIAREVHDELGQMLTGLKMDLTWIEKRLPGLVDHTLREALAGKAKSMFGLLDHMVKTVRRISAELRPGVLDDLGLVSALEWQARDWETRTSIPCRVEAHLEGRQVPPDHGVALFRIFQESLTNVARHAAATQVLARLRLEPGWIVMEIEDNGRGLAQEEGRRHKSFGLLGMRERAAMLGGECAFSGEPGRGTTVKVRLPLG